MCLVEQPIAVVCQELARRQTTLIEGPVTRTGATGTLTSVYIRDPDGNLLELARYDDQTTGDRAKTSPLSARVFIVFTTFREGQTAA